MRIAEIAGWAFLLVANSHPLVAQQDAQIVWRLSTDRDTVFTNPGGPIVLKPSRVLVPDAGRQGLVELDGITGRMVRVIGRSGDGPGEYRSIALIAASDNQQLIAVYDQARRTADLLMPDGRPLARIPTGIVYVAKGAAVLPDSTIVISGGRSIDMDVTASVVWFSHGSILENGPRPPPGRDSSDMWQMQSRTYVSGGRLAAVPGGVRLVEAASGDIWSVTRRGTRRLARGPGNAPAMVERFMRPTTVNGRQMRSPWYSFPQAVYAEPARGGYIEAWSIRDESKLRLYYLRASETPLLLSEIPLNVYALTRYDGDSFILVGMGPGGDFVVERVRIPFPAL